MRNRIGLAALAGAFVMMAGQASAFCGFYVAKADAELFNEASKVVLARDGDRTVVTMVNDYQGDPTEFAMVIPTPTVLEREQIHIGENAVVEHLDAYTAPRLVEYHDPDPCRVMYRDVARLESAMAPQAAPMPMVVEEAEDLGVTIEAEYTIGEYDIVILSATESDGLQIWLDREGYNTPPEARGILGSYIKQDMKFFVARVNLEEKAKLGGEFLRPIQIAYEHDKFMLPIRLGTVNAKDTQDLIIYMLTRTGRVETTNYRTVRIPTDMDLPVYLKSEDEFAEFYKAMFAHIVEREDMRAVFLEYAWDMNWCDPCAADPLSARELRSLGAFWVAPGGQQRGGPAQDVFATRLHLRYDAAHFPEDLRFHETGDRSNFQGRYVMRHPFTGDLNCPAGRDYAASLEPRFAREASALANITGWDIAQIRQKMRANGQVAPEVKPVKWWEKLWE